MQDLLAALCLVLVVEGLLPFISPGHWRKTMSQLSQLDNRTIRIVGAVSMLVGLILLKLVK